MSENQVHAMVDIETLSTKPNAFILQIGAVLMGTDKSTFGATMSFTEEQKGAEIDGATVKWWQQQDAEVKQGVFTVGDTVTLKTALIAFCEWLKVEGVTHLWANSPNFDCVILESAIKRELGEEYCRKNFVPFYRWLDVRTLRYVGDMINVNRVERKVMHSAIEDAQGQVEEIQQVLARIALTSSTK